MKKHILLIIFTFLLIPTLVVFANPKDKEDESTQPVVSQEEQSDIAKCNNVTKKVEMITERYDQNKNRYINAFQNIHRSMEKFALRFKADGYDTVQLEAHITDFNNMIQNAISSYNEFRVGLENAKGEACGGDNKEAQQEFTQARKDLKDFKDIMIDLKTYVKDTLREDIMDLRKQVTGEDEGEEIENEDNEEIDEDEKDDESEDDQDEEDDDEEDGEEEDGEEEDDKEGNDLE